MVAFNCVGARSRVFLPLYDVTRAKGLVGLGRTNRKKSGTAGNRTQIATDKGACSGLVKGRHGTRPLPPNQVSKAVSRRQLDGTNAQYSRDTTTRQFRGLDWSGGM
jgi:hypothetical protein